MALAMDMPAARVREYDSDDQPVGPSEASSPASAERTHSAAEQRKKLYLTPVMKFTIACTVAIAWTAFSVWLSLRWLSELAAVTSIVFAVIAITFIAYIPGFMNAFLLTTLSLDRRLPRRVPSSYPEATILVAVRRSRA